MISLKKQVMDAYPEYTKKGWEPIFMVYPKSKILIIGQAPGIKTQELNDVFRDKSGDRLRSWLDVDEETFYKSGLFSVLPLDFYFPGKAKVGDLPPNKDFTRKWHPLFLDYMKDVELIILLGNYAIKYYLNDHMKKNLTETVRSYSDYLPKYFPLPHPSPLNQRWEAKNPWFNEDVIPHLKQIVHSIIDKNEAD